MRWFNRQYHHYVTLAMRALQLASSALALGFVASSFQGHDVVVFAEEDRAKKLAITMHYGGPTVNFALVVTYSAAVYALLWIAFVYVQTSVCVPAQYSISVDAIFTVMLLSAGCAVAASDFVRYCTALAQSVHCSSLKAGAAFCFIAFVAFLISVAWGAWIVREQISESKAKATSRRQQQQLDVLERSPSSDASNSYLETTFVY
ncbi:Marvel domain [Globisporangium polare]